MTQSPPESARTRSASNSIVSMPPPRHHHDGPGLWRVRGKRSQACLESTWATSDEGAARNWATPKGPATFHTGLRCGSATGLLGPPASPRLARREKFADHDGVWAVA